MARVMETNYRKPVENVLQAIGNTPIVRLHRVTGDCPATIWAKLEFTNPGGSIKDRIGWWMIEDAERAGRLKPGGTIVEATSGNTGMGLAMAAAIKGYPCIFVLADKMSQEKIKNLRAFGAKVVVTPTAVDKADPRSYYSVARRLADETPGGVLMNQYDNLSNRDCHYKTTGPEILGQMPEIDAFIAGIGTGGTTCGVGKYLKEKRPGVKVVAVDPIGSLVYEMYKTGKATAQPKTYKIEGIGEDFIPKNYDFSLIDDVVQVEDKESFLMARDLLLKEGLWCGISSGSAVVGALKWVKAQKESMKGKNVLVILPDSGNRYMSKVFDDDWMREAGFLDSTSMGTVADLLHALGVKPGALQVAKPGDKLSNVIERLRELDVSQLPVIDDKGWIKGIITESALLKALYEGRANLTDPAESLADPSVEFVTPQDSLEKVSKILTQGKLPLVTDPVRGNTPIGIVTKIDLLAYMGKKR